MSDPYRFPASDFDPTGTGFILTQRGTLKYVPERYRTTEGEGMPKPELERLLSPAEVAELLGVDAQLLADWRSRKVGPPYLKLGWRTVRYEQEALRRWLKQQQNPTNGDARVR